MGNYLETANSWIMWLAAIPISVAVLVLAFIYTKRARAAGDLVGLTKEEANQAFRVGMTSAIGPGIGVFIVMLGLMSVVGGPMAWMRLSVIGAAPTELTAANMAAQAQGVELGGANYDLIHFANATWVMALNGSAWLLATAIITHRLDRVTKKISGGDPEKIGILMITAMLGAFAFMVVNEIHKSIEVTKDYGGIVAVLVGAFGMVLFEKISDRYPVLKEFNLGIVMVIAMALAYLSRGLF